MECGDSVWLLNEEFREAKEPPTEIAEPFSEAAGALDGTIYAKKQPSQIQNEARQIGQ
jgi:hypothetical protein